VRTAPGAREAVASLVVEDGASLELALTLPPAWPLRPAAVSIRRAVGVPDVRLRRWMLSIAAFLRAFPASDVMYPRRLHDPVDPGGPHSTITLAAAVEEAARDA
jgi:hypothetical protein